jgi:hypothetical protein
LEQSQIAANVVECFRQRLGSSLPYVLNALPDAFQSTRLFGLFPLTEQTNGLGDRFIGGRKPAAFDLRVHESFQVFG